MSSDSGNAQGRKENKGSNSPNIKLQKEESRDPDHSNARDREHHKGGDNAKNL